MTMPDLITELYFTYREANLADLTRPEIVVIKPFDQNSKGKVLQAQKNTVNITSLSDLEQFLNGSLMTNYGMVNDVTGEIPVMQDPTESAPA